MKQLFYNLRSKEISNNSDSFLFCFVLVYVWLRFPNGKADSLPKIIQEGYPVIVLGTIYVISSIRICFTLKLLQCFLNFNALI